MKPLTIDLKWIAHSEFAHLVELCSCVEPDDTPTAKCSDCGVCQCDECADLGNPGHSRGCSWYPY